MTLWKTDFLLRGNGPTARAIRRNYYLLISCSESRRQAIGNNLVVATSFVDFRKAFDCVCHSILLHKLKHKFGIEGNLLSWITDYLNHRSQITIVNSTQSINWTWLAVSLKDRFLVQFCLVCTPMTSQRVWFLAPYTCTLATREFTLLYWIDCWWSMQSTEQSPRWT